MRPWPSSPQGPPPAGPTIPGSSARRAGSGVGRERCSCSPGRGRAGGRWPRTCWRASRCSADTLERCDALLRAHVDWSLLEQLTVAPEGSRLADPAVAQPALCAVQIALAALWRSWGVEPAAVVGHSVGEIAAAHVAGALDPGDALRVALHRGEVISGGRRGPDGRGRPVAEEPGSWPNAVPERSGWRRATARAPCSPVRAAQWRVSPRLEADGVFARVLESVDFASHSPLMDPLRTELGSGCRASPRARRPSR